MVVVVVVLETLAPAHLIAQHKLLILCMPCCTCLHRRLVMLCFLAVNGWLWLGWWLWSTSKQYEGKGGVYD